MQDPSKENFTEGVDTAKERPKTVGEGELEIGKDEHADVRTAAPPKKFTVEDRTKGRRIKTETKTVEQQLKEREAAKEAAKVTPESKTDKEILADERPSYELSPEEKQARGDAQQRRDAAEREANRPAEEANRKASHEYETKLAREAQARDALPISKHIEKMNMARRMNPESAKEDDVHIGQNGFISEVRARHIVEAAITDNSVEPTQAAITEAFRIWPKDAREILAKLGHTAEVTQESKTEPGKEMRSPRNWTRGKDRGRNADRPGRQHDTHCCKCWVKMVLCVR